MASFQYTIHLPSRPDSQADGDDRWAYHHILPWRYYYVAAHTLIVMVRVALQSNPELVRVLSRHRWAAAIRQTAESASRVPAGVVPASLLVEFPVPSLLELFASLSTANDAEIPRRSTAGFDPGALAMLCGGPRFGGFSGMLPEDRLDDPEEAPEPLRPHSLDRGRWGLLMSLCGFLNGLAPTLGAVRENRQTEVVLTEDAWRVMVPILERLVALHNRVHPFVATDWDFRRNATAKVPWIFLDYPEAQVAPVRGESVGCRFALNLNGRGDESTPPGEEAVGLVRGGARLYFLLPDHADWAGGPRPRRPGQFATTTPQIRPTRR